MVLIPLTASAACLADPIWFFLHFFVCFAPFFVSPIYHLFMCHQGGCDTYQKFLTFDVCGVWAINAFGGLCGIRAIFYCMPFWSTFSLTFYIVVSLLSIFLIMKANSAKERFKPLIVFGVMRYFFISVRLFLYAFTGQPSLLPSHITSALTCWLSLVVHSMLPGYQRGGFLRGVITLATVTKLCMF